MRAATTCCRSAFIGVGLASGLVNLLMLTGPSMTDTGAMSLVGVNAGVAAVSERATH
jgi:hypothetical protein